jgi:hypothetical protein
VSFFLFWLSFLMIRVVVVSRIFVRWCYVQKGGEVAKLQCQLAGANQDPRMTCSSLLRQFSLYSDRMGRDQLFRAKLRQLISRRIQLLASCHWMLRWLILYYSSGSSSSYIRQIHFARQTTRPTKRIRNSQFTIHNPHHLRQRLTS